MLSYFSRAIPHSVFQQYGLKHYAFLGLSIDDLEQQYLQFTAALVRHGLADWHDHQRDHLLLHPMFHSFLIEANLPLEQQQDEMQRAFVDFYDTQGNVIDLLLKDKPIERHLLGRTWAEIEIHNLKTSHYLALKQHRTVSSTYALTSYLRQENRWSELYSICQTTLDRMEEFPQAKRDFEFYHQQGLLFNRLASYWQEYAELEKAKHYNEKIIALYNDLKKNYNDGEQYGNVLFQADKWQGESFIYLGNGAFLQQDFPKALGYYHQAEQLFTASDDQDNLITVWNMLGTTYSQLEQFSASDEIFRRALNQMNDTAEEAQDKHQLGRLVHNYVLFLLDSQLDSPHRIQYYLEQCIEIFEAYEDQEYLASSYHTLGNYQVEVNNYSAALTAFKNALSLYIDLGFEAKQVSAYQNLGWISGMLEQWADAQNHLQKALRMAISTNAPFKAVELQHNLGNLYLNQNQWSAAIEQYKSALAGYQNYQQKRSAAEVHHNIGMAYLEVKQSATAWPHFKAAVDFFRSTTDELALAESHFYGGMAARNLDFYPEANSFLRQALDYYTKSGNLKRQAECFFELGVVAFGEGNDERALALLAKAKQFFAQLQLSAKLNLAVTTIEKIKSFLS